MKKLIAILAALSILASSLAFAASASAVAYDSATGEGDVSCSLGGTFYISNGSVTSSDPSCAGIVSIPNGVTSIGSRAFFKRNGITQVFISDTVTSIGERAFYENSNLTAVYIGNGVTSISESAFEYAEKLTSLTIGSSVQYIGGGAFSGSALTSVTIPDSVTTIGGGAFFYILSLRSLTIGNSVTTLGYQAFEYAPLRQYTYCGTLLSSNDLNLAGLSRKTKICPSAIALPNAPTSVTATSTGAATASISFTAPASDGGAAITSYTATSSPGGITGSISQAGSGTISMTGLTAGTAYTFTVTATNSAGTGSASTASNSTTTVGAPSAPTSVVATATGKRSATVSFGAPSSSNGSAVTSYTVTSTPGGITKTLTQATGGTFTFDGLQPGTAYTFAVTATNAIGTSAAATSNSIKTDALVPASLTVITFTEDGTGTAGKLTWTGKNIDAVLYTGPANSYPGPFTFGAFSTSWNGTIRNLTPDTQYTVSIFAISVDGIGESKSLTFKTGSGVPAGSGVAMAQSSSKLTQIISWVNQNSFVPGEAANIISLLTKFDALVTSAHRSSIKVPTSRVSKVEVKSLTPKACSVVSATAKVDAGLVSALTHDTCTISYTVSGASKAWATLVKDFTFKKVSK